MLTGLQLRILNGFFPGEPACCNGSCYHERSKIRFLLGADFLDKIRGKTILDFGCGEGSECVELAQYGAKRVIGIDIREDLLEQAREKAARAGVEEICSFACSTDERADLIICVDAFEHFGDPAGVLATMAAALRPQGEVLASFGPTWYHPMGGHLFSVFPWAHLIFSEEALIRWRSRFKSDGATRFSEVAGGLNRMSIRQFENLVANSRFQFLSLELVPIRSLRLIHNRLTREFTTSIVRCRLGKRV